MNNKNITFEERINEKLILINNISNELNDIKEFLIRTKSFVSIILKTAKEKDL